MRPPYPLDGRAAQAARSTGGGWPQRRAYPQGTRAHKAARVYYLALYRPGVSRCAIGCEILHQPPRLLDLAHSDDGTHYLGLACRRHNRGPGPLPGSRGTGRIGNRTIAKQRQRSALDERDERQQREQREIERRERIEQRERERRARQRERRVIVAPDPRERR